MKRIVLITLLLLPLGAVHAAKFRSLLPKVELLSYAVPSGLLNAILAKELCSCRFISGVNIDECFKRANLPEEARVLVDIFPRTRNPKEFTVTVRTSEAAALIFKKGPEAEAVYLPDSPQFGCRLTAGPLDVN